MRYVSKFLPAGILFLMTLAFGNWVSRSGKPYNNILFNIHKLIALGAVIITAAQIRTALINTDIWTLLIVLIVVAGLCAVALFATGALMSIGKLTSNIPLIVHHIAPVLLTISMVVTVYLLSVNQL